MSSECLQSVRKGKRGKKCETEEEKYDPAQMTVILAAQVQSQKKRLSSE